MKHMSTNQKIETSREVRQWIKSIIIPGVAGSLYLDYKYPDLKYKVRDFCKDRVDGFKDCFLKKEEKAE